MKLAEALIIRAELQTKYHKLEARVRNNLVVQEGEVSPEDPVKLIGELKNVNRELTELIGRINSTNANSYLEEGLTLTQGIAKRDGIMSLRNSLEQFVNEASAISDRYSLAEIKKLPNINVEELQKEIDRLSKEYRLLDIKIQEYNWKVDLI